MYLRSHGLIQDHKYLLLCFLLKVLEFLAVTLGSLDYSVNFFFFNVVEVESNFILLHWMSSYLSTICWKIILSYWIVSALCQKSTDDKFKDLFLGSQLHSSDLYLFTALTSVPHCLDHLCNKFRNWQVWILTFFFFFFEIVLVILCFSHLNMIFRTHLVSAKKRQLRFW